MATINFDVTYSQTDNPNDFGVVTYNGENIATDGRLDLVGSSVTASGFTVADIANCTPLKAAVTCTRTSESTMTVRVVISGGCDYGYGLSYGYGYDYRQSISLERVIENVELIL